MTPTGPATIELNGNDLTFDQLYSVALQDEKPNAIAAAVSRARKQFPKLKVEVEADNLAQVAQADEARAMAAERRRHRVLHLACAERIAMHRHARRVVARVKELGSMPYVS